MAGLLDCGGQVLQADAQRSATSMAFGAASLTALVLAPARSRQTTSTPPGARAARRRRLPRYGPAARPLRSWPGCPPALCRRSCPAEGELVHPENPWRPRRHRRSPQQSEPTSAPGPYVDRAAQPFTGAASKLDRDGVQPRLRAKTGAAIALAQPQDLLHEGRAEIHASEMP